MEYIQTFKNMIKLKELGETRIKQLSFEENIDNHLTSCFSSHPQLVFSYLMSIRKLNRHLSLEAYNSHVLDYPSKLEHNLNTFDSLHQDMLVGSCEHLDKVIRSINDKHSNHT